jgi:PAS domain S-box-containing protein
MNMHADPQMLEDSVPAMVWRARPDLSCEYLSRPWLEFTGYSREQALGDGWSRGVHPEDLSRWLDTCVRAFDLREPFQLEYRLRRRDGEYRWVLDRGVPRFAADGAFLGYVGTCIDIEERKRAESGIARSLERERTLRHATEEASRMKDGFLNSVLERLESPVQAIVGWATRLRAQLPAGSEAARALDAIEGNARAQRRMIDSLLDLSRETAGPRSQENAGQEGPLLHGMKVLVVDDDPGCREKLAKILSIAGADTKAAASASEALETLSAWRADVLLASVGMRGDAAYVLIRAVRALPERLRGPLRAAALLPAARSEEGARALAAGFDAQLAHPVEPVALIATVAKLFERVRTTV